MKNEEMKKIVKAAFEGYIEFAEDEKKIIIDLNGFDEECKDENNELDLDLTVKLNEMLIDLFEENGYEAFKCGELYAEDGQFRNVNPDTVVVIK